MSAKKTSPAKIPVLEDFKLSKQQTIFHDAYCDGETKGNANASAVFAGYTESSARKSSFKLVPPAGSTGESIRSASPTAQAIFWTLYRRRMIRDEIDQRASEQQIVVGVKRQIITKEYVEGTLYEIVERCMARPAKILDGNNRDLGRKLAREFFDEIRGNNLSEDEMVKIIASKFATFASKFYVFKPTQAKEALRLLGTELGMFNRVTKASLDTPVDAMSPEELLVEQKRLEDQYSELTAAVKKKGNGAGRAKH